MEGDKWDDSAIVDAFNRALASHDGEGKPAQLQSVGNMKANQSDSVEDSIGEGPDMSWKPVEKPTMPIPMQMPSQISGSKHEQDLSALLLAWYNAGYQAGRYEALYGGGSLEKTPQE